MLIVTDGFDETTSLNMSRWLQFDSFKLITWIWSKSLLELPADDDVIFFPPPRKVATRRTSLCSRWDSDLHSDRSLILPLTLMAVELSGDTGAAIQSYIHVQSVWGNTPCHNNYDRSMETILWRRYHCPTSVPLDWPWLPAKSLSFLKTSLLGGTKQFPSSVLLPFSYPLREFTPYVHDNTLSDRQGGAFKDCHLELTCSYITVSLVSVIVLF